MEKSKKILIISNIILIGFILSVVVHYYLAFYLNVKFPLNTYLFMPDIHFSDFSILMPQVRSFAPFDTTYIWITYFPLIYIFLYPFSLIPSGLISYTIFASTFLIPYIIWNVAYLKTDKLDKLQNIQNIIIITVLAFPFFYILDRGSTDMWLFLLFAAAIIAFKKEKYWLSAILFAVQNAIKPFAIMFLILFLLKKKYKEFFTTIILSAILVIGGFLILNGNFYDQVIVFIKDLMLYKNEYVLNVFNNDTNVSGLSLFTTLRLWLCKNGTMDVQTLLVIYNSVMGVFSLICLYFTSREKTFWKQTALLTLIMLFVPYVMADYKLIFLFVPMWFFVNAKEGSKLDWLYAALFGLLMIPKRFLLLSNIENVNIIINALLLFIFICAIIFEQIKEKKWSLK